MNSNLDIKNTRTNRSHYKESDTLENAVRGLKERIVGRGELEYISVSEQLALVDQLCAFPFGRYVLEHRGANGFWTDYLIFYKEREDAQPIHNPLEDFLLNRSLIILSHRERFQIYQSLLQKRLKEGAVLASIPCGLMRDLLTLDFSGISDYKLVGIDIDPESLELAQQSAEAKRIYNVEFVQQDAWQMTYQETFDVITSSGLNVYEPDPEKVIDLYRRFFTSMKPGGSLIISALTYPPMEARETDWNLEGIPSEVLLMERVLHKDILELHWRNFRSAWELDKEFKEAGFSEVSVHFDKHRIFPTIHAMKAL